MPGMLDGSDILAPVSKVATLEDMCRKIWFRSPHF